MRQASLLIALCGLLLGGSLLPCGSALAKPDAALRVLKLRYHEANHPHRDVAGEFRLLSGFARHAGLRLDWNDAVRPAELRDSLLRGDADIVVADLSPITDASSGLQPSLGMGLYRYTVVGRHDVQARNPLELAGLRVAVSLASPLWSYMNALEQTGSGPVVVVLPDDQSRTDIIAGIENGLYDAAVVTSSSPDPIIDKPALRHLFTLSGENRSVWWFRDDAGPLRRQVNAYVRRHHAALAIPRRAFGDLDQIRQRRVLRVITRVDPQNYFLKQGRRAGFEYELIQQFTRTLGLSVEYLVADSEEQVHDWLDNGVGDLATTRLSSQRVSNDPSLAQSRPYFHSATVIINHVDDAALVQASLNGQRVAVLRGSVQHQALGDLLAAGIKLTAVVLNPDTTTDELARYIEMGQVDAALIDAHAFLALRAGHPLIQAGASLPNAYPYAWTSRRENTQLGLAVDHFLRDNFRTSSYNIVARRYFHQPRFARFVAARQLSPFDDVVRRHAEAFDFDWRLIVAQMYQESKFDPHAKSSAGALGLMQLLPSTARSVGVLDPHEPEAGIRGGVAYLDRLRRRFDADMPPRERTWFALAAYNIGFHRVELARQAALRQGLDPNRWFGQVEYIMRDMATTQGGCRCGQTVVYVRGIRSLYSTYSRLQETLTAGLNTRALEPPI